MEKAKLNLYTVADLLTNIGHTVNAFSLVSEAAGIDLAEWVALSVIAKRGPMPVKKLRIMLGISGSNMVALRAALLRSNLLAEKKSGTDRVVEISPVGKERLREANAKINHVLRPQIDQHAVSSINSAVKWLSRTVRRLSK